MGYLLGLAANDFDTFFKLKKSPKMAPVVRATHQIYLDTSSIFTKVVTISNFSTKLVFQSYRKGVIFDQFDLSLQKVNQYS